MHTIFVFSYSGLVTNIFFVCVKSIRSKHSNSGFDINSLTPGRCDCNLKLVIFKLISRIDRYLGHFLWNYPQANATRSHWWLVNIGSGNDLVPQGLPEPMLTQIYVNIWHHQHNESSNLPFFLFTQNQYIHSQTLINSNVWFQGCIGEVINFSWGLWDKDK